MSSMMVLNVSGTSEVGTIASIIRLRTQVWSGDCCLKPVDGSAVTAYHSVLEGFQVDGGVLVGEEDVDSRNAPRPVATLELSV